MRGVFFVADTAVAQAKAATISVDCADQSDELKANRRRM
jgi:hypothetical protein